MFYGADLSAIRHSRFGDLAREAGGYLLALLKTTGLDTGTVVDLGCGSGILARIVGDAGNDVMGVDISADRLASRVHDALVPGGMFLFDVAGPGRHGPDAVRFHDHHDWFLVNNVEESPDHRTLDRRITIFTDQGEGAYRRSDEHHVLRLYEPSA